MTPAEESRYLHLADSYWGECRDVRIEIRRVSIVKTRKPHRCMATDEMHAIEPGSAAVRDSAKVLGKMGVAYTCLPCLDKWATEIGAEIQ